MSNTPYITLNEAAKLTGRAKSTISKALKNGKVSYVSRDEESGAYEIDPAEVLRVFPKKQETSKGYQKETHVEHGENPLGNSVLSMEVKMLREQISRMDADTDRMSSEIEDLRDRLTKSDDERCRLTAMLTDQRDKPVEQPKGLFRRLFG